jgi:hypothetical protein
MRETHDSGWVSGGRCKRWDMGCECGSTAQVYHDARLFDEVTVAQKIRPYAGQTVCCKAARRFTRKNNMFAVSDCTQFCPNAVAATRRFANH